MVEEVLEQQNNGATKKRGVDHVPRIENETMADTLKVAGPTQWALGAQ